MADLKKLIDELRKYPVETQWLEFKHNNYTPEMIGQDISALANSAALYDRKCAYMIWGIDDVTHDIVGTEHNLQTLKTGCDPSFRKTLISNFIQLKRITKPLDCS